MEVGSYRGGSTESMLSIFICVIFPVSSITPVRCMLFLSLLHMCGNTQRYQMTYAWSHSG